MAICRARGATVRSMMITLTYRIETPGSVEAMAEKIASDQSTGTFVPVPGETEELKSRVAARVLAIRSLEDARHQRPEVAPAHCSIVPMSTSPFRWTRSAPTFRH